MAFVACLLQVAALAHAPPADAALATARRRRATADRHRPTVPRHPRHPRPPRKEARPTLYLRPTATALPDLATSLMGDCTCPGSRVGDQLIVRVIPPAELCPLTSAGTP